MKLLIVAFTPIHVKITPHEKSVVHLLVISSHSSLPSKKTSEMIREGIIGISKGIISGTITHSKTIGKASSHHEISIYHEALGHTSIVSWFSTSSHSNQVRSIPQLSHQEIISS
jgi:hypothetical protein